MTSSEAAAPKSLRLLCDRVYDRYHDIGFMEPDPLQFVVDYPSLRDREVVGMVASAFALGRVAGINAAVANALARLRYAGPSPSAVVASLDPRAACELAEGFAYRFFGAEQLAGLLLAIGRLQREHGTLDAAFAASSAPGLPTSPAALREGLALFTTHLRHAADGMLDGSILIPDPSLGGACKRLLLFLRWMVRHDSVDPGGWLSVAPSGLIVPVDTHMLKIATALGFTRCRQASWRVSVEITEGFRALAPDDPVRYDFSLTRLGIHPDLTETWFLDACRTLRDAS
ncbi:MAG: TIGR02757 family protein [Spirochaetaceae bacterium]|nr:MAG: TIGR02757 family protein [Spirochaetaceae bacterium]